MNLLNSTTVILAVSTQSPYSEARETYQPQQPQLKPQPAKEGYQLRPTTPPAPTIAGSASQTQSQPSTVKQIEFFKKKAEKEKELIWKKTFKYLLISSIVLIIIGIILATILLPLTTKTPEEVEDATENKTPEELKGKSWTMLGTIKSEEELEVDGQKVYSYEFEDSDLKFKSSEDIGDKGDTVVITIENTQIEPLEATCPENVMVYYLPGIILIIIGIIHLMIVIIGILKKKKT